MLHEHAQRTATAGSAVHNRTRSPATYDVSLWFSSACRLSHPLRQNGSPQHWTSNHPLQTLAHVPSAPSPQKRKTASPDPVDNNLAPDPNTSDAGPSKRQSLRPIYDNYGFNINATTVTKRCPFDFNGRTWQTVGESRFLLENTKLYHEEGSKKDKILILLLKFFDAFKMRTLSFTYGNPASVVANFPSWSFEQRDHFSMWLKVRLTLRSLGFLLIHA
jgi:hypothetical protein